MVYMFADSPNDDYSLNGYMNWTLSVFDVKDFTNDTRPAEDKIEAEFKDIEYCRYVEYTL